MEEGTVVESVILGWNQHDGTQFAPHTWAADSATNANHCCPDPIPPVPRSTWTALLEDALSSDERAADPAALAEAHLLYASSAAYDEAPSPDEDMWWPTVGVITDTEFACPTRRLAFKLAERSAVRLFEFSQRSLHSGAPPRWGVYHASDLQYLFDVRYPYLLGASDFSAQERELISAMRRLWSAVAVGDAGALGVWPQLSVDSPSVLSLEAADENAPPGGEAGLRVTDAAAAQCAFWEAAGFYNRSAAPEQTAGAPSHTDRRGVEADSSSPLGVAVFCVLVVGGTVLGVGVRGLRRRGADHEHQMLERAQKGVP